MKHPLLSPLPRFCYWTLVLLCGLLITACHPIYRDNNTGYYTWDASEENSRTLSLEVLATFKSQTAMPAETTPFLPQDRDTGIQQIGLLLPLTGPLGDSGNAIRNGILAAYYQFKSNHTIDQMPKIKVYDSTQATIDTLYQRAVDDGADWVIGPLTKSRIRRLLATFHRFPVPILALNTLNPSPPPVNNMWFFGLSTTQESIQMANWAYAHSHLKRAVVITTQDHWGHRLAAQFSQQWEALGGDIVSVLYFDQSQTMNQKVRRLLHVDKSEYRAQALKQVLRQSFRFLPQIRQDIDTLFFALLPQQAKQVRSFLKFHYAGHIPVFSISTLYAADDWKKNNTPDIEGIYFSDIPWMVVPPHQWSQTQRQLQKNIMATWQHSFQKYPRLYALGIDAFQLIYVMPQWSSHTPSHLRLQGLTGQLSLPQPGHTIIHTLPIAQIQHGRRVLMDQ